MAKPYIDRSDVELLVQIAGTGSLTKAAKALGIHHATAFRRLTDLEQHIGVAMFERLPQGYVPTMAGERLLIAARRLQSELLDFDAQLQDLNASLGSAAGHDVRRPRIRVLARPAALLQRGEPGHPRRPRCRESSAKRPGAR